MTTTPRPLHLAYEGTGKVRPPAATLDTESLEHSAGQIDPDRHAADSPCYDQRGIEVPSIKMPKIRVGDLPVVRVGDGMRVPAVRVGDAMRVRS